MICRSTPVVPPPNLTCTSNAVVMPACSLKALRCLLFTIQIQMHDSKCMSCLQVWAQRPAARAPCGDGPRTQCRRCTSVACSSPSGRSRCSTWCVLVSNLIRPVAPVKRSACGFAEGPLCVWHTSVPPPSCGRNRSSDIAADLQSLAVAPRKRCLSCAGCHHMP